MFANSFAKSIVERPCYTVTMRSAWPRLDLHHLVLSQDFLVSSQVNVMLSVETKNSGICVHVCVHVLHIQLGRAVQEKKEKRSGLSLLRKCVKISKASLLHANHKTYEFILTRLFISLPVALENDFRMNFLSSKFSLAIILSSYTSYMHYMLLILFSYSIQSREIDREREIIIKLTQSQIKTSFILHFSGKWYHSKCFTI